MSMRTNIKLAKHMLQSAKNIDEFVDANIESIDDKVLIALFLKIGRELEKRKIMGEVSKYEKSETGKS